MQKLKGRVAGIKVKPVDTTGAGDSFVAGLLYCFASDMNLYQVTLSAGKRVFLVFKVLLVFDGI